MAHKIKGKQAQPNPPRLAIWLLKVFCSYDYLPTVLWDLGEIHETLSKTKGKNYANYSYWRDTFSVIIHLFFKGKSLYSFNQTSMFKNNLINSIRNLRKDWSFNLINIAGLAIGLSAFILISLYIGHELSYDRFHPNYENTFRVSREGFHPQGVRQYVTISHSISPILKEKLPEIQSSTRVGFHYEATIRHNNTSTSQPGGFYVDSNFFDFFGFTVISGATKDMLIKPDALLITKSMAERYFGSKDVVGETLILNNETRQVTAIIADPPKNSVLQFSFLTPLESWVTKRTQDPWIRHAGMTFLKIDQKQQGLITSKIDKIKNEFFPEEYHDTFAKANEIPNTRFSLQNIHDIYLKSTATKDIVTTGEIRYIYLFGTVGIVILIVSITNYFNLHLARSFKRSKEFGIRKVVGASRISLAQLYLIETLISLIIAFSLALLIAYLASPWYQNLIQKSIFLTDLSIYFWAKALCLVFVIFLLLSIYPAVLLSKASLKSAVEKSSIPTSGKGIFKRSITTFQLFVAQALIISTFIIQSQLNLLQNKDIGYNQNNLIYIPLRGEIKRNLGPFVNDLKATSGITQVSTAYNLFDHGDLMVLPLNLFQGHEGNTEEEVIANLYQVGPDFLETMGIELIEKKAHGPGVIINQAMADRLGWKNPTQMVIHGKGKSEGNVTPIIGLTQNFNDQSLKSGVKPLIIKIQPDSLNHYVIARLADKNISGTLTAIDKVWWKYAKDKPLSTGFFSEKLKSQYANDHRLGSLVRFFSFLAIGLSLLGTLGLGASIIQQKLKEMSIRKVLGASFTQMVVLINKSFLWPAVIGFILTIPTIYLLVQQNWLANFVYRVEPGFLSYFMAFVIIYILTAIITTLQCMKLQQVDPTEYLKQE